MAEKALFLAEKKGMANIIRDFMIAKRRNVLDITRQRVCLLSSFCACR